ncbi:MAG TPA: hypothetical protein VNO70_03365, partial [Blastocatellia bacterium]|nr:hypothetical protein [Blastocatellia bacterium]
MLNHHGFIDPQRGIAAQNISTTPKTFLRVAVLCVAVALTIAMSPTVGHAQINCDGLQASGDTTGATDSANISSCLNNPSFRRAHLLNGDFYINQPIVFPLNISGVRLTGVGSHASGTIIWAVYTSNFVDSSQNRYKPIIDVRRAPNAVLSGFRLRPNNLRRDFGHKGTYA